MGPDERAPSVSHMQWTSEKLCQEWLQWTSTKLQRHVIFARGNYQHTSEGSLTQDSIAQTANVQKKQFVEHSCKYLPGRYLNQQASSPAQEEACHCRHHGWDHAKEWLSMQSDYRMTQHL